MPPPAAMLAAVMMVLAITAMRRLKTRSCSAGLVLLVQVQCASAVVAPLRRLHPPLVQKMSALGQTARMCLAVATKIASLKMRVSTAAERITAASPMKTWPLQVARPQASMQAQMPVCSDFSSKEFVECPCRRLACNATLAMQIRAAIEHHAVLHGCNQCAIACLLSVVHAIHLAFQATLRHCNLLCRHGGAGGRICTAAGR